MQLPPKTLKHVVQTIPKNHPKPTPKFGKSTINEPFSIAMLVYQRVNTSSSYLFSTATFWVKTITTTVETNKETDAKVTGGEPARSAGSCELGERADSKPQKR